MGNSPNKGATSKIFTVATLNYCGIMNSPYEFYCADYKDELEVIGERFRQLIPKYFPNFENEAKEGKFQWKMGKVDHQFRTRYSPMFRLDFGIQDNRFMTEKEIETKWETEFKQGIGSIPWKEQQKNAAIRYDKLMFHALVRHVYKDKNLELANLSTKNVKTYLDKYGSYFKLSFLDQKQKCLKTMNGFQKINADIFFFQEYSNQLYEQVVKLQDSYFIATDSGKDTMIVANKRAFTSKEVTNYETGPKSKVIGQLKPLLSLDKNTSVMVIDDYILLNFHLSSNKESNAKQVQIMKKGLATLRKEFSQYEIIAGGDFNTYLENVSDQLESYPHSQKDMTTLKKRTISQGQFKKANKEDHNSKDKVLSTKPIITGKISSLNGRIINPKGQMIPNDNHPFDHFLLVTYVETKLYGMDRE